MVVLRIPKLLRREHLGMNRLAVHRQLLQGRRRHLRLRLVVGVDAVTVLRAAVIPHLIEQKAVVAEPLPEELAQAVVAHLGRVVLHEYGLRVARGTGAYRLIRRIIDGALRVSDRSGHDARLALEGQL
eukprot:1760518-Prymnesium_polylepis.1